MKEFEFTKDHENHKKGETIQLNMQTYHKEQHPLIMRGILKTAGKEKSSRYEELKKMNKNEQANLIKSLAGEEAKIPLKEEDRIKLITELEER